MLVLVDPDLRGGLVGALVLGRAAIEGLAGGVAREHVALEGRPVAPRPLHTFVGYRAVRAAVIVARMHYPQRASLYLFLLTALGASALGGCNKTDQTHAMSNPAPARVADPGSSTTPSATTETASAARRTGPIAPGCTEWNCAEVEMSVSLACNDPRANDGAQRFGATARISGVTDQVSCAVSDAADGSGRDLRLMVRPANGPEDDASEVNFQLRGYVGPGTYPLINLEGEGDFMGLEVVGNVDAPSGTRNAEIEVGTAECRRSACEAVVAEGSEPIPNDEYAVHPFRVRVEVRCPAGSEIGEIACHEDSPTCAFTTAPMLVGDFLCGN